MHVTLASTSKTVDLQVDGAHVPARIWEGHTASGVPVIAFITRITPDRPPGHPDTAEFQRDLAQVQPPSAPADAIPMRMIL